MNKLADDSSSRLFYTQGLSRFFGGVGAVNKVDFTVRENELVSLIGPNGAGKTTLVNVITGLYPPTSGKVIFKGEDVTRFPPHKMIRKGIARTFQISSVFLGLTVYENIRLAKQNYRGGSLKLFSTRESLKTVTEETWELLERVGLADSADSVAKNLAYGQIRVLEIALGLSGKPVILFLDEPTAGMSYGETHRMTELIRKLTDEQSVVVIEHDMDVVMSISDRITVLEQGRIIAEGKPEEIQQNERVKEAYLGTGE
jgi:branched-chain amino acid transport system ATP-binding protein